jgi:hypothetical protein
MNATALNSTTLNSTALNATQSRPGQTVVSTYRAGLTTRSQLATVTSATLTLFVLGQLLLRWIVL